MSQSCHIPLLACRRRSSLGKKESKKNRCLHPNRLRRHRSLAQTCRLLQSVLHGPSSASCSGAARAAEDKSSGSLVILSCQTAICSFLVPRGRQDLYYSGFIVGACKNRAEQLIVDYTNGFSTNQLETQNRGASAAPPAYNPLGTPANQSLPSAGGFHRGPVNPRGAGRRC